MLQVPAIKRLCAFIFFAAAALLLSGCGGSSSSSSDPAPSDDTDANPGIGSLKAGYFKVTPEGSGAPPSMMILTPTGECLIAGGSYDQLAFCSLDVEKDAISGTLTQYLLDNDQWELSEAVVSGTVTSPETANLVVKMGDQAGQTGSLEMVRDDSKSDRGINFDVLSDTYSFGEADNPAGDFNVSYTVAPDGELTGSDGTGCVFNGEVTIPDLKLSIVKVEYTAANCGDDDTFSGEERNGEFSGLGVYNASAGGVVEIVGNNSEIATVFVGQ